MGWRSRLQARGLDASSEWYGINAYNQIISLALLIMLALNWGKISQYPGLWILQIMDRQNEQERLFCTGCFSHSLFFCQYFPYKLLLFIGLAVGHKILLLAGTWQSVSQVRKIILNKFKKYMICVGALFKVRGAVILFLYSEKKDSFLWGFLL